MHARPRNPPVPPDTRGVSFDQLEKGVRHCMIGRTVGSASVAVAAPCTFGVAPETDLRRQPMRRSVGQRLHRTPVDVIIERRRFRDRIVAMPCAVELGSIAALFRREAENIPSIDRRFTQRTPVAPPAAVARSVKPGLKLGKLSKTRSDCIVRAKTAS